MKKQKPTKRTEFTSLSKVRPAIKSSLPRAKKTKQTKENRKAAAKRKIKRCMELKKQRESKLMLRTPVRRVQDAAAAAARSRLRLNVKKSSENSIYCFFKNMRSMNSSERIEELFSEVHRVAWDAILISETWRQGKEIWKTQQGHIIVESGKFIHKHGVAVLLSRRWKNQINWVQCACERVVALSISVNKQPITLMSLYMPHSGYPDHHVATIEKDKNMKIIGGDFNAELGPGKGIELSSVGHYTLIKANCRGERMTQLLLLSH